ncbi:tetratricopeptide repeat protein [Criblamydia sequanensis]|uniref:TPR repeat-containing protein n=1 Tax=Candidatus Criblamydia sequanensis CRIB-18 TaxID=1437425 RepID=A0A090DVI7_9BACT|nr:hypothetical protein [Criblamydia sequanensis]CDR32999.1 hypothetical protein CSEC_0159 [Criblamydia sequanensis CRIB-18]
MDGVNRSGVYTSQPFEEERKPLTPKDAETIKLLSSIIVKTNTPHTPLAALAVIYFRSGWYAEALEMTTRALESAPKIQDVFQAVLCRAEFESSHGMKEDAERDYLKLKECQSAIPESFQSRIEALKRSLEVPLEDGVSNRIKEITLSLPGSKTPWLLHKERSQCYLYQKQYGRALLDIRRAASLAPNLYEVWEAIYFRTRYLMQKNMLKIAFKSLDELSICLDQMKESEKEKLEKLKNTLVRQNLKPKKDPIYQLASGGCKEPSQAFQARLKDFKEKEAEEKEDLLSKAISLKKKHEGSLQRLIEDLKIDTHAGPFQYYRAEALYHEGRYSEALDILNASIEDEIENPHLYFLRSCIYYSLQNLEKALEDIELALLLSPIEVKEYLHTAEIITARLEGGVYVSLDFQEEARKKLDIVKKNIFLHGESSELLFEKINLHLMLQEQEEAKKDALKLKERLSEDDPHYEKVLDILQFLNGEGTSS